MLTFVKSRYILFSTRPCWDSKKRGGSLSDNFMAQGYGTETIYIGSSTSEAFETRDSVTVRSGDLTEQPMYVK